MSDQNKKVLAVVSGGLDSVTMAYDLQSQGFEVSTISFNYGQRHNTELHFAHLHARREGWVHDIINLQSLGKHLESSLTGFEDVPEGHYAEESMKATIVPNRNAIMLSIACGVAVSKKIPFIATAVHGGDHFIYPDCRPLFLNALSSALSAGNEGFLGILAPYIDKDKNFIAQRAVDLEYPFNSTWSCYKGGEKHCGKCGTCVERMEALWSCKFYGGEEPSKDEHIPLEERLAYVFPDDLYEDNTYWMSALEAAK